MAQIVERLHLKEFRSNLKAFLMPDMAVKLGTNRSWRYGKLPRPFLLLIIFLLEIAYAGQLKSCTALRALVRGGQHAPCPRH